MVRHPPVEVNRQLVLELAGVKAGRLGERRGDLFDRPVETVDHGDDFGAQARRDKDGLVDVALAQQRAKDLVPLVLEHGDALEQVE